MGTAHEHQIYLVRFSGAGQEFALSRLEVVRYSAGAGVADVAVQTLFPVTHTGQPVYTREGSCENTSGASWIWGSWTEASANVLTKTNNAPYTPDGEYRPATKKYVDDAVSQAGGGDMSKSVYDTNGSGVVDDAEMLGGQPPSYYATTYAVNGKAPANHANMNTIYGVGTTMSYGHVKITDDFAQDERKHGIALSGYAGYVLDSRLTAVETGTLPVSKGGTGATTASGALANLGIKIQTTIPTSLSNDEIVFVVEG